MLKLTEVVTESGVYNSEKGACEATYSLRSVYVNPDYIVSMTDNLKFNSMHNREPVINGLISEAKFTKLMLAAGSGTPKFYDILGAPERHYKDIHSWRSSRKEL